ncbi:MAG: hypothetical protein ACFFCS_20845 [Candidatus Hodarchaeota archaeon]
MGTWKQLDDYWIIQVQGDARHFGVMVPLPAIIDLILLENNNNIVVWSCRIDDWRCHPNDNRKNRVIEHMLDLVHIDEALFFHKINKSGVSTPLDTNGCFRDDVTKMVKFSHIFSKGTSIATYPESFASHKQRSLFTITKYSEGERDLYQSRLEKIKENMNLLKNGGISEESFLNSMEWLDYNRDVRDSSIKKLKDALKRGEVVLDHQFTLNGRGLSMADCVIRIYDEKRDKNVFFNRNEVQVLEDYDAGNMWRRLAKRILQCLQSNEFVDIFTYWRVKSDSEYKITPNLVENYLDYMNPEEISKPEGWCGPDIQEFLEIGGILGYINDHFSVWAKARRIGKHSFQIEMRYWDKNKIKGNASFDDPTHEIIFIYEIKYLQISLFDAEGFSWLFSCWYCIKFGFKFGYGLDTVFFSKSQRLIGYKEALIRRYGKEIIDKFEDFLTKIHPLLKEPEIEKKSGKSKDASLKDWTENKFVIGMVLDVLLRGDDRLRFIEAARNYYGKDGKEKIRGFDDIPVNLLSPKVEIILQDEENGHLFLSWINRFIDFTREVGLPEQLPHHQNVYTHPMFREPPHNVLRGISHVLNLELNELSYIHKKRGLEFITPDGKKLKKIVGLWWWIKNKLNKKKIGVFKE